LATRTARQKQEKNTCPHREQTRHRVARTALALDHAHTSSIGLASRERERERENPKRKSKETAAVQCVQRCCCAAHVVHYRARGHEAHTARFSKFEMFGLCKRLGIFGYAIFGNDPIPHPIFTPRLIFQVCFLLLLGFWIVAIVLRYEALVPFSKGLIGIFVLSPFLCVGYVFQT
jgi:hypothetical protein